MERVESGEEEQGKCSNVHLAPALQQVLGYITPSEPHSSSVKKSYPRVGRRKQTSEVNQGLAQRGWAAQCGNAGPPPSPAESLPPVREPAPHFSSDCARSSPCSLRPCFPASSERPALSGTCHSAGAQASSESEVCKAGRRADFCEGSPVGTCAHDLGFRGSDTRLGKLLKFHSNVPASRNHSRFAFSGMGTI